MDAPYRILIVGAGIGGLALRALRVKGFLPEISDFSARLSGWFVTPSAAQLHEAKLCVKSVPTPVEHSLDGRSGERAGERLLPSREP